ncbi:hypothetical protein [Nannocystis pusilla]|uniref:hypothetical protein n=1 Tax=Nannocystis pusilla TaxID=889268 RepID=UPI003B765A97
MLQFGERAAKAPEFVPDPETRTWLARSLAAVVAHLGPPARKQQWVSDSPLKKAAPRDLDALFELVCVAQEHIGQGDVEITLAPPGQAPRQYRRASRCSAIRPDTCFTRSRAGPNSRWW